ncbi:Serine acetyltransferase 1 [Nymphaea thermarum]|nr:Serine acetyltransferase 1 [Nymphaea thermarum]
MSPPLPSAVCSLSRLQIMLNFKGFLAIQAQRVAHRLWQRGNVKIGAGAKIGAGSVVLKEVPDKTTVVGNPARLLGGRENPIKLTNIPSLTTDHPPPQLPLPFSLSCLPLWFPLSFPSGSLSRLSTGARQTGWA